MELFFSFRGVGGFEKVSVMERNDLALHLFRGVFLIYLLVAFALLGCATNSTEVPTKPLGDAPGFRRAEQPAAVPGDKGGTPSGNTTVSQRTETGAPGPQDKSTSPVAGTINVTARVNTPPVALPDSASIRKNTSVAIDVLTNDYDPDPNTTPAGQIDPASVTITTKPRKGAR